LIMAIAMLTCASGSGEIIDVGTKCECEIAERSSTSKYYYNTPHEATGECFDSRIRTAAEGGDESITEMDVFRGQAVEFYTSSIPTQASESMTFDFWVTCKRMCSISRVEVKGCGWCGGNSVLRLYDSHDYLNGNRVYIEKVAPLDMNGPDVCGSLIINGSTPNAFNHEPLGSGTPFGTEFTIRQTSDLAPVNQCQENLQYWRCRNSLSMVLSPMPNIWDGDTEPVPGVCVGDCADWTAATTTSTPTTTSSASSTSPTDEASSEPTNEQQCHSAEDCIVSGSWCDTDTSVCVSGSDDPSGSSSASSSDSTEETTHCYSDDECRGSQICDEDAFECVDSSSDSSTDSSKSSSSDSRTDSSGDSSSASSGDSSEEMTHCHNDDECRGSQICDVDAFECVDSSSDSSSDSSKDSSKDSGDGSDSSEDLSAVALRYQRCAARVKELEAWQETLLSMTAAKHIQGGKDEDEHEHESEDEEDSALGVFGIEEALIVCLVLTNVVLLAYLCRSHMAKKKPIYAGVASSEQEDLCD